MNTELRLFVKALFPKRVLFKYEQNLRFFLFQFYRGTYYQCT